MTTDTLASRLVPVPAAQPGGPSIGKRPTRARFRFGSWLVDPLSNSIANGDDARQMEPRTMDVLVALCRANGAIVSVDELLEQCWGSTIHGDSTVHKNLAHLRRLLGDNANAPLFIETIRKRGYRTVAEVDFAVDEPPRAAQWDRGSPFRGLLPFDEAHAGVFHGRDAAILHMVRAAHAQIDSGLALLLLLGPSGSGKTSLVQAGLFPAMSRPCATGDPALRASTTFDIADQGEQTLFAALASAMLDLHCESTCAFVNENAIALGKRLELDCEGVAAQLRSTLPRQHAGQRYAIFIDRFEALFNASRVTADERDVFLVTLEQLARSGSCLLVLACRNDFYPSIARYPMLIEGKAHGGHIDLAPPAFSDIAQMIRKPAAAAQLTFGIDPVTKAGLDDILCDSAARSPDALPLLQYCLHELYRLRTPAGELSFEAFHELGDLEGAIGRRAEQAVTELDDAQRAELPHIMSLVTVLSLDEDQVTSQRAPWVALRCDAARHAVIALIEARLFVSDLAGGLPVFGIAHEAILRRWPRMSEWIAAHRDALRARGRLAQQATRWNADGRRVDLLIPRGKLLDEARDLQRTGLWSIDPPEADLIRMSNRRARQFEWMRITGLGLIILLAILTSAFALNAYHAQRAAEARRAEVERLVDFMLGDFADKLRPLGKLDLLESISGKALQTLRASQENTLSPAGLTLRAKALQVIGDVSRSRGNAAQGIEALGQANAILVRQHAAAPRDIQVLSNLGINAYWVGQLHKDHNNMPAAERAWRQYLDYTNRLHQLEPHKVEWWVEQSYAHNNLGSLAFTRGAPGEAATEFAASIALKQRALDRAGGAQSKTLVAELADSYSWLALARQALGELDAAGPLLQRTIDLVQELRTRYPDEPMWVTSHVRALQLRASLSLALGRDDNALADLREAGEQFSQVAAKDSGNHVWQVELANMELDLVKVLARREPASAMLPRLRRAHATLAATLRIDPKNARWARSEAVARGRVAAALLATGDAGQAGREIETAVGHLRRLYAANQASVPLRLALVEALLVHTAVLKANGQAPMARAACREAFDAIRPGSATMDFEILAPWGRAALCLGEAGATDIPWKRLQQIGYRDSQYRQLIPTR
ncbi:MAG TPA: winged helix-turn-helix domain-containing protein [Pseudoduganella sp.]|jgi:DNA-binding winged helix-turn-helix (wHTH) protein/tetratricopeptide (TPR) repeat protein